MILYGNSLQRKKFSFIIFILATLLICSLIYVFYKSNSSINFYASTYGIDSNSGTKAPPFKTLEGAGDAIRKIRETREIHKNINVFLRGGNFFITKSFVLEKMDSDNGKLTITYKFYKKEKVFFMGGYNLASTDFKSLEDKAVLDRFINKEAKKNILVADLSKYSINFNSSKESISNAPELFYNNKPLTIARFPNDEFLSTGQAIKKANDTVYSFKYTGFQPLLWNRTQDI